jgi:hypothetical protein
MDGGLFAKVLLFYHFENSHFIFNSAEDGTS